MKRRILSLLFAICILLCIVPTLPQAASAAQAEPIYADPLRYGWQVLQQMDNADSLLYAYAQLVEGVTNCENEIVVSDDDHAVSVDEFSTVVSMVRSDYPELFWFNLGCSYYTNSTGQVTRVIPSYSMSGTQLEQAKSAVAANAELLLTGLEDKSDYEISKLLHDRLSAHMSYAYTDNDQTIYGALAEKQAVCAGYAAAYQYLLQQAGIPAWRIDGSSYMPGTTTSIGHSWTLVCLDGNWYHTDVTWDDQGALGDIYYAYLNVTTAQILQDHTIKPIFADYLPDCTATEANYFIKNDGCIAQFDVDAVVANLQANNLHARFYVTGDVNEFLQSWSNNIYSVIRKLGITGQLSYGYRCLGQEVTLYINDASADIYPVAMTITALPNKLAYEADAPLDATGGKIALHYSDGSVSEMPMTTDMISGLDRTVTGRQVLAVSLEGCTEYFTVSFTASEIAPATTPGDLNGDSEVTNDDVVTLLWFTLFPDTSVITGDADFTGDGEVTNDDVVALLWYTLFPDTSPL